MSDDKKMSITDKLLLMVDEKTQKQDRDKYRDNIAETKKNMEEETAKARAEMTPEKMVGILKKQVGVLKTELAKKTLEANAIEKNANNYIEFLKTKNGDLKTAFSAFKKSMELNIKENDDFTFEEYSKWTR